MYSKDDAARYVLELTSKKWYRIIFDHQRKKETKAL
jgi:hypothetical protein